MVVGGEFIVGPVLRTLQAKHPQVRRYREQQTQNIVRPYFLVEQLPLGSERRMNGKARSTYRIRITYVCKEDETEPIKHLRNMGNTLLGEFQLLRLNTIHAVFGRNLEFEIVNGELLFTAEFPVHLNWQEEEQPQMQELEANTHLKN